MTLVTPVAVQTLYASALDVYATPADEGPSTVARAVALGDLTQSLRSVGDATALLQGACLVRLKHQQLYKKLDGCENMSWPQCCEQVLGLTWRRAKYLMRLAEKADGLGITRAILDELGFTKLREVVAIATPETVGDWLAVARQETHVQLVRRVAQARQEAATLGVAAGAVAAAPAPGDVVGRWTLTMTADQRLNVVDAIDLVRQEAQGRGTNVTDAEALDLIATDFRANHLTRTQALPWHLRQLERVFGVQLREGAS